MSTKFRQCFILLCDDCRRSSKGQRSPTVYFGREHTVRQIMGLNGLNGVRTISTTGKVSYHQGNPSQFQEKKTLLVDNTPTPVTDNPNDEIKFVFPECFTGVIFKMP
jgi:hypothetical protein